MDNGTMPVGLDSGVGNVQGIRPTAGAASGRRNRPDRRPPKRRPAGPPPATYAPDGRLEDGIEPGTRIDISA